MYLKKHTIVVDLAVSINVCFPNHLIDFRVREFLSCEAGVCLVRRSEATAQRTKVRHDMTQLGSADVPITVLIEHLEGLLDLLLAIRIAHLACHHCEEFGEIDRAVAVRVDFVNHVLELSFRRVLPQRPHHSSELFGGDCTISVCVG